MEIIASYFGNIFINQNHVLDNVLYIPNSLLIFFLLVNLIHNLFCVIIFYSNDYHIQNKNWLKMIRLA